MILFNDIYGHKKQIAQLLTAKKSQRLPHALLFAGPEGIGKKKIAFALAQSLLCEVINKKPQNPSTPPAKSPVASASTMPAPDVPATPDGQHLPSACGKCPACLSVKNQKSFQIMFIQPEGLYIKVDSIRAIGRFTSLQSLSLARVIIMDSAHQMNIAGANSFLKLLEEPPDRVYFFLISSSMSALPVTIRSRTQIVRFAPLSAEDIRLVLQKNCSKPEEKASMKGPAKKEEQWLIEMSQGSLSHIEKWRGHSDLMDQALELLGQMNPEKPPCSLEDLSNLVRDRQKALLVCSCWQRALKSARIRKATKNSQTAGRGGPNKEKQTSLRQGTKSAVALSGDKALQDFLDQINAPLLDLFFEKAIQLEQDLKAHVDSRLLFDNFLFFSRNELQAQKKPLGFKTKQ